MLCLRLASGHTSDRVRADPRLLLPWKPWVEHHNYGSLRPLLSVLHHLRLALQELTLGVRLKNDPEERQTLSRGRRVGCGVCHGLALTPASKLWSLSAMPHVPKAAHCLVRDQSDQSQTKQKLELVGFAQLLPFAPPCPSLALPFPPAPCDRQPQNRPRAVSRSILRACCQSPHMPCDTTCAYKTPCLLSIRVRWQWSVLHNKHGIWLSAASEFKGRPSRASSPPGIAHFLIERARPPHSASSDFERLPLALKAPELLVASRPLKVASRRRSRK